MLLGRLIERAALGQLLAARAAGAAARYWCTRVRMGKTALLEDGR
jgi:hypothetical protein